MLKTKHINKSFSISKANLKDCLTLSIIERHCKLTGKKFNFIVMKALAAYVKEKRLDVNIEREER